MKDKKRNAYHLPWITANHEKESSLKDTIFALKSLLVFTTNEKVVDGMLMMDQNPIY